MTNLDDRAAATGPYVLPRPRAALPALCITQIVGWGVIYYAFPVLNPAITADTGWPTTATTAAYSAALLVSAFAGIPIGRILDARGPRTVMTTGSILGVASMLAAACAPNLAAFTAAWLLAGVSMAATLYQPAFAAVARWWGDDRVRAITIITLAGGLASTVFAPFTATLNEHLSWRTTYVVLAIVLAASTIPAHALALRAPWPPAPPTPAAAHASRGSTKESVARTGPFVLLAAALTVSSFAEYAVVIALVPLFAERGVSTTAAAWALGLGGAGQTLGRSLYVVLTRRTGVTARTVVLIAAGGLTTLALAVIPGPVTLLTVISIIAGMVRGNLTLLQATAVPDRWGATHYGRLSGLLAAPTLSASALAPFAGAALAVPLGGYANLFILLAAMSGLAAALALGTHVDQPSSADHVDPT
ncbi:MFS transporter [Planotetraspora thailandica]|uniref:MFS transporter n=1 Tax=Planotetraspora thailandica TaxID=487172 RepID=A0A8J3XYC4_9ACTN|nr:MFS transporter [Planotetraspora thailandica]GII54138.1 MFS transporter [Planotetraspora thailandica]